MMTNWSMIINGCTNGDSRYQKLLYEEYYGILLKMAFRYVSTYEQALELTQNGFVKIFYELNGVSLDKDELTKETLSTWIKRTFIIILVDHIKSAFNLHKARPIPGDIWKQYDRPFTDKEMMHIELITILKGLPILYRLVFNLHVIDGFTHREIARVLDTTVEDSKQNLIKAREYINKSFVGEKYM